jgi:hypothetical protein
MCLQEEYLGRYKEVFDEKQRTTMEAESCVSIAHEAHRIMRRLEKQLQLLLDPPLLQPPDMPAADAPSSSKAAASPAATQQLPAASKPANTLDQARHTASTRPCLQQESIGMCTSSNTFPASNPGIKPPSRQHQQQPSTFASQQQTAQSTAATSTVNPHPPSFKAQPVDYSAQLQHELQKHGKLCGVSCRKTTLTSSRTSTYSSSNPSSDSTTTDQHTTQHSSSWGPKPMQYQQVQPDGTVDGAIAALDAMLSDPLLNSLVAKYAPHAACPTAWHAAAAAVSMSDPATADVVTLQCLQDSMEPAEPPAPGQPSGAAPLVASVAAAASRRRLLQEQRKRQDLHAAEWQRLQETAAAHVVNKLCRTAEQKHASMRIRMRRFLRPASSQAQEDREDLQLAEQALRSAPRLQPGLSAALAWLEKRRQRVRQSWQRKSEQLGGRTAVWMVCTVEPWLKQVQGRAGALLAAVQKALLPATQVATAADTASTPTAAPAAASATVVVASTPAAPSPASAATAVAHDIEAGLKDTADARSTQDKALPRWLRVWTSTNKAAAAALAKASAVCNSLRNPASFVAGVKINMALMMQAANTRVEAAHKSSEAAAAAAAMRSSTAARKLLITLLPFMMNAAEHEQVKKQQDDVKNRRRLPPQEGYSWDVYPTLAVVLEEQREFKPAAAAARAGQMVGPEADVFRAFSLGASDLQERQQRRTAAAGRSAAAAAEARALQDMQAALQHQQQWQLWSAEWQLRLQLAASYVPVLVSDRDEYGFPWVYACVLLECAGQLCF